MSSVTRQPTDGRQRRETAEARIFAAVERLLGEGESYTSLGMQRIADEAGVARSTLYVHFADKTDLLRRLSETAASEAFGLAETFMARGRARDGKGLEATTAAIIAVHRRHRGLFAALTEVASYDPEIAHFWRERVESFARTTQAQLEDDRRTGRVPEALDPEIAARWIAWGTEHLISEHVARDDSSAGDARLARGIAQLIRASTQLGS